MIDFELEKPQFYKNMAVIPIITPANHSIDILTLKKGFELELASIKECPHSTVNTLIVENKSVVPLLLVDGEEVIGGDQNRIMDTTVITAPQSEMKIPVNCSEQGRWSYKHDFVQSENIANYHTRVKKAHAFRNKGSVQNEVWDSIAHLEADRSFHSPTNAMSESYENAKKDLGKILNNFKVVDGQSGVAVLIDGELKGFEMFLNQTIYRDYHEKILKSYLIDVEISENAFTVNMDSIKKRISAAFSGELEKSQNIGLESRFDFSDDNGVGTQYVYDGEIIHMSYFEGLNELVEETFENIITDDITI